ncbi:MAG: sigma-70 family RNA polymerase sigma factor [Thermomicrobia bacterium]|nr:sigma-70 family RNA polymerase sigma factor [Thermomicrobia bacterium]
MIDDAEISRDDATLIARIVQRDPTGISLLYDRYGGVAFALAYRLLSDRGDAEDVVQGAFLNVWRRASTYNVQRGTVRTWLLTIVHHQAITVLRSMRARGGATVDIDAITPLAADDDVAATVGRGLDQAQVRAALATLPSDQQQVVTLAYFSGLTHREISEYAAIPLGTVKGRMRLALEKLRFALRQADYVMD